MGLMLNKWFGGNTINMMVLGGVSMLIAGVLMMFVKDSGREAQR
jgi:predicted phage tail protein